MDRNKISPLSKLARAIVALRKESVDRNKAGSEQNTSKQMSLSARRAWIEIAAVAFYNATSNVALRKESVDRNENTKPAEQAKARRSPQGERG